MNETTTANPLCCRGSSPPPVWPTDGWNRSGGRFRASEAMEHTRILEGEGGVTYMHYRVQS